MKLLLPNLIVESALPGKQLDTDRPVMEPTLFMLGIVALAVAIQVGLYFIFRHTRPRDQKEPRKKLPLSNWRKLMDWRRRRRMPWHFVPRLALAFRG